MTIGPQLSVDAGERQVTMDRSLQSLPASLQAVTLYEAKGELIDAAGGLLEFSDLLKRPLDAFKYLQLSVETGEVALTAQNVQLNCVMIGSANELHLDAFREHAEFASFRGRLELVRVPYLRSYEQERLIYDTHVAPQVRRHVAPHATEMAAVVRRPHAHAPAQPRPLLARRSARSSRRSPRWRRPTSTRHRQGRPSGSTPDSQKLLRASINELWDESDAYPIYEGRIGASPREMRVALLDAAQSPQSTAASTPMAVLDEIDALCQRKNEFEWLQQDAIARRLPRREGLPRAAAHAPARGLGVRALRGERRR